MIPVCHGRPACLHHFWTLHVTTRLPAAHFARFVAAHAITSSQQECMRRLSQLHACMQAACDLFGIRSAPCLFITAPCLCKAWVAVGARHCGCTQFSSTASSQPGPCLAAAEDPSRHCSSTCSTKYSLRLPHLFQIALGAYKAWPPSAAEDSQWRCGNTCCTSCWCKARRAGQPIRSRQPRRRHAAAPAPVKPAASGAMGAAAALESGSSCAARAAAGGGVGGPAAMLVEATPDMGAAGMARPAAAQADMVNCWGWLPCRSASLPKLSDSSPAPASLPELSDSCWSRVWGLGCPGRQQDLLTVGPTSMLPNVDYILG